MIARGTRSEGVPSARYAWTACRSSVGSAYGAAGALVVLLVWIYYSALIFFLGAEFTQVYATRRGRALKPVSGFRRKVGPPGRAEHEPASQSA